MSKNDKNRLWEFLHEPEKQSGADFSTDHFSSDEKAMLAQHRILDKELRKLSDMAKTSDSKMKSQADFEASLLKKLKEHPVKHESNIIQFPIVSALTKQPLYSVAAAIFLVLGISIVVNRSEFSKHEEMAFQEAPPPMGASGGTPERHDEARKESPLMGKTSPKLKSDDELILVNPKVLGKKDSAESGISADEERGVSKTSPGESLPKPPDMTESKLILKVETAKSDAQKKEALTVLRDYYKSKNNAAKVQQTERKLKEL